MLQRIDRFQDVHIHAAAIGTWNQTYTQISAGLLESSLVQISNPRCHVFRERINRRVVQHGEAPKDRVCFALPIAVPGSAHMQGREADDKSLFFLRGGEEFMFHMPMDMDMLAITFDQRLFDECLASIPQAAKIECLLKQPVIKVPPGRLLECRSRLLNLVSNALGDSTPQEPPQGERALEAALLEELLVVLADPECDAGQRQPGSTHSYIVEKLHRLTVNEAVNAPSIFEASKRLHVSRRTVQNSFRTVAGTTPLNYLRSVRLNGVRRELMSTCSAEISIGDLASRWGFFHMSHFAEDYQELFNELPSQTPRTTLNKLRPN
jgi:AraC-like DNA-binding protein